MKKIMIVLLSLSGGGAERTVLNIIRNIDRRKYSPIFVIPNINKDTADYGALIPDDIDIVVGKSKKLRIFIFELVGIIKSKHPDILFTTTAHANIALTIARYLSFERPKIILRESNNTGYGGHVSWINKTIKKVCYNQADRVIALSNGVKETLEDSFGVVGDKIEVIYNPVDLRMIDQMKREKVLEFDHPKNIKVIVSVSRLCSPKDHFTLIRAFEKVQKIINSRLIIVGKGDDLRDLEQYCDDLGISDKVMFVGFQANPYKFMAQSDVFVFSSKLEGFAHVVAEALAVGIPVVATDCPCGPNEVLEGGKCGYLVPVGDSAAMAEKIITVLSSDNSERILRGSERVRCFSVDDIVGHYEQVFDAV